MPLYPFYCLFCISIFLYMISDLFVSCFSIFLLQTNFVSKLDLINQDDFYVGLSSSENAIDNKESRGLFSSRFLYFLLCFFFSFLIYFSHCLCYHYFFLIIFYFSIYVFFTASQECLMTKPIEYCTVVSTGITIFYNISIFTFILF
jgi:hypothetical protein